METETFIHAEKWNVQIIPNGRTYKLDHKSPVKTTFFSSVMPKIFFSRYNPTIRTAVSEAPHAMAEPTAPIRGVISKLRVMPTTAPVVLTLRIDLFEVEAIRNCCITICSIPITKSRKMTIRNGVYAPSYPLPDRIRIMSFAKKSENMTIGNETTIKMENVLFAIS